jgi:hypothetical protein
LHHNRGLFDFLQMKKTTLPPAGKRRGEHRKETDMNAGRKKLAIEFAEESRFDARIPAVPARGELAKALERAKHRLLLNLLRETPNTRMQDELCHAATEASTIAWMTPYPLLVFPVLLEEKAREARFKFHRQEQIRERTETLYAMAV